MPRIIETQADLDLGVDHLVMSDRRMGHALERSGPPPMRRRDPGLHGLMAIIVSQQLSVASANAIFARFEAAFSPFNPGGLAAAEESSFRACGLSGPKIRTIRSIATSLSDGTLDLGALIDSPADDAHAAMVKVKGIGPWTADIYLMFCLGHADGFAAGDLALQESAKLLYDLERRPTEKELVALAERWRPYRSIAARLLWSYYRVAKSREGIGVA